MNKLPEFDEGEDMAAAAYFEMLLEKKKNPQFSVTVRGTNHLYKRIALNDDN